MTPDEFIAEIKRTLPGLTHFSPVWHHKGEDGPEIGVAVQSGRESSIPIVRTADRWRVNFCSNVDLLAAWKLGLDWAEHERRMYAKTARAMKRAMKPREVTQ